MGQYIYPNSGGSFTGGTVSGETNFIGGLSASTIFSGSTNLYDIFAPYGSGGEIISGGTTATTISSWTASGGTFYADFVHGLDTNDYVIGTYLTTTGYEIIIEEIQRLDSNTLRIFSSDDSLSIRIIIVALGGGSGNGISGPGSSLDNSIVRFNGGNGKIIKNSNSFLDDSGILTTFGLSGSTLYSGIIDCGTF